MPTFVRSSIGVAVLLLCACGASFGDYPQAVIDSGPAAYWRFESVNDASLVNGFTSSYQGDATVTGAAGGVPLVGVPTNRALSLDGTGDFVSTSLDSEFTFADTYGARSSRRTRPAGPDPRTAARSTPSLRASSRTDGAAAGSVAAAWPFVRAVSREAEPSAAGERVCRARLRLAARAFFRSV